VKLGIQQYETKSKFVNDIVELRRFRAILYFELSTSAGFILSSFWPINLYIIIAAAILFTPYMLYVLIKEKKYGWIVIFFLMVVLPYPIIYLIIGEYILLTAWLLLPVIPFYLYCFLIKFSVDDWLREYNWEQQLIEQRKEWEEKKKEGLL
jgi:predicted neutral ceramidase superfamily lipid hydrolase